MKAKYLKAYGSYLAAEMKSSGSGDAAKRDEAIATALGKFDAAIAKKCDPAAIGSDVLNTAPPAGLGLGSDTCGELWGASAGGAYETACAALPAATTAEKSACWRCFLVGELRAWLKMHYPWVEALVPDGTALACATPPVVSLPPSTTELKCLTAVPKLATALLLGTEKVTAACLDNVHKGKIAGGPSACPDAKGQTAIAKLEEKMTAGVAKACQSLPSWWDECPASDDACESDSIDSVAALSACSNDAAQASGAAVTCGLYVGADADGITCPTPAIPTPTPTAPPTPSPTPTALAPACCQFGGGTCGGGNPQGCLASSGSLVGGGAMCDASGQCATGPVIRGGCCQYSNPVAACSMPIDQATCQAGGGVYKADQDFCSSTGSCTTTARVFVTSTTVPGNFGGYNGAQSICQARATAAGLDGLYAAWLSDAYAPSYYQPAYQLFHVTHPYQRLDGRIIADDWWDLTDGTLDAAINVTEFGQTLNVPGDVWTNTKIDGTIDSLSNDCGHWTSNSGAASVGSPFNGNYLWTSEYTQTCALGARLYCFEQR